MLSIITLLVTSLLATVTVAQAPTTNFSSSVIGNITGTGPYAVGLSTLNSWCNSQYTTCGTLCGGATDANSCNGATLTYTCTCSSNHSSPALAYYAGTIPFFICNAAKGDCMAINANDLAAQQQCNATFVCGNSSASTVAPATTTAASSSAGPATTGSATGSATASPSATKASAAMTIGAEYGVTILAAGLLAAMALVL